MFFRKYLLPVIIILASLLLGSWLGLAFVRSWAGHGNNGILVTKIAYTGTPGVVSSLQSTELSRVNPPQELDIPRVGVHAVVEKVGLDSNGDMDVPKQPFNVAWYSLGVTPGQNGNAVIDGHLDSKTGPAVFYRLGQLEHGDQIIVTDSVGETHYFKVSRKESYLFNQVPLKSIFGPASNAHLNLITCAGHFDRPSQNYSQRIVIYSDLVAEKP